MLHDRHVGQNDPGRERKSRSGNPSRERVEQGLPSNYHATGEDEWLNRPGFVLRAYRIRRGPNPRSAGGKMNSFGSEKEEKQAAERIGT